MSATRRTKIVCTIGPASDSPAVLRRMIAAGMDVARLNFSHGTLEDQAARITLLRRLSEEVGRPIAILQDLPGTKIRIGEFRDGRVTLRRGAVFALRRDPSPGDDQGVYLPSPEVWEALKPGDKVFLADGLLELRVFERTESEVLTRVVTGGELASRQGVTVPRVVLPISGITERDVEALRFGLAHGVDWVAVSFVRSPDDLRQVRALVREAGGDVPLIAKIEKHEAVQRLDEIVGEADGVMVARGDLGVELPIHEVALTQKHIIQRCNKAGKPVITATQMLESMTRNPRPTRAEVTDVTNACLDGTDAVMLSGETAAGRYPVEAVRMMAKIVSTAERSTAYSRVFGPHQNARAETITDAIGEATAGIARDLGAAAIMASTFSGYTARMVSRYRPKTPIIGVTANPATYRRLALSWGVRPLLVERAKNTDDTISFAVEGALREGLVKRGDLVVITAGVPAGVPGNTNLIKVQTV
ncbi:MAG: pyruvate kinase [Armatimonadota bacterium]